MPWYLEWTCQFQRRGSKQLHLSRGGRWTPTRLGGRPDRSATCHVTGEFLLSTGRVWICKCKVAGQRRVYYLKHPHPHTHPAVFRSMPVCHHSRDQKILRPGRSTLKQTRKKIAVPPSPENCCLSKLRTFPRTFEPYGIKVRPVRGSGLVNPHPLRCVCRDSERR